MTAGASVVVGASVEVTYTVFVQPAVNKSETKATADALPNFFDRLIWLDSTGRPMAVEESSLIRLIVGVNFPNSLVLLQELLGGV